MKLSRYEQLLALRMPHWLRLAIIALATLILCSCSGLETNRDTIISNAFPSPQTQVPAPSAPPRSIVRQQRVDRQVMRAAFLQPNLPRSASTGFPGDGYTVPGPAQDTSGMVGAPPQVASQAVGQSCQPCYAYPGEWMGRNGVNAQVPWAPPGIRRPWPYDEYLFDGGDQNTQVVVDSDWTVRGLDSEDTVRPLRYPATAARW